MKLSIDLGGTNIRIAQVEKGNCLNKVSVPCLAQQDASTVLNQLSQLIRNMMNEQVDGIGIGVPSIVDPENSNCFTLGESLYGEGKSYTNMVGVTIGTGIGAGVVIGRRLYGGQYMGAGEIGSFPYLDSDFEHYCSSFLFKRYGTTGAVVAEKAQQGEQAALEIWKEFGRHLGNLIKAILFAYAPQAIVLGGGIVSAFPFFKNAMEQTMQSFPYKIISDNVSVVASHQKDSSLLGAAALLE